MMREALADYSRALIIQPENAGVYHNRGIVNERLKRYEDALQDFTTAIKMDPAPSFMHARSVVVVLVVVIVVVVVVVVVVVIAKVVLQGK